MVLKWGLNGPIGGSRRPNEVQEDQMGVKRDMCVFKKTNLWLKWAKWELKWAKWV